MGALSFRTICRAVLAVLALAAAALAVTAIASGGQQAIVWRVMGARVRITDPSPLLSMAGFFGAAFFFSSAHTRLRLLGNMLSALAAVFALLAIAGRAEATPPVGDVGVIETYIFEALRGRLFLGPYSRFLWHHPGPIYFFALAPFYVLSGYRTAGVAAGVLTINIAAVTAILWVARRHGNLRIAAALAAACAAYAARFSSLLTSQWNPHALVFPTLAFIVFAAGVAAGATGLIPALVALGSFAAQTHLGLAPTVAAVSACALTAAYVALDRPARSRFWWHVNAGMWTALALWLLPIVQEITGSPGNLTRLWQFFTSGGAKGQAFGAAFSVWAGAVSGAARTGFALAWGGEVPPGAPALVMLGAVALLMLLAWSAMVAWRRHCRFEGALAALVSVALLVALWSVTRIAGEVVDHEVFWMSGLGVLAFATVAGIGAGAVTTPSVRWPRFARVALGDTLFVAGLIAVIAIGTFDLFRRVDDLSRPGNEELAAATLSEEIVSFAKREQVPKLLIKIDGGVWGVAAGVLVELDRANVPYAVDPGAVWMFGDGAAPDGRETRTILISGYGGHGDVEGKPGVVPLAARRGFFADVVASR